MAHHITLVAAALSKGEPYYDLRYRADLPAGCQVHFCMDHEDRSMPMPPKLTVAEMEEFFALIPAWASWGHSIRCWFEVRAGEETTTLRTPDFQLPLPVAPYIGELNTVAFRYTSPVFNYPGNGMGRVLTKRIGTRYFFVYGGKLTTDAVHRGLDCTTFPLALFQLYGCDVAWDSGLHIAQAINAANVGLEAVAGSEIKLWFAGLDGEGARVGKPPDGAYLIWRVHNTVDESGNAIQPGHILLYRGLNDLYSIHQFNKACNGYPAGYSERCVKDQSFGGNGVWHARRIDNYSYVKRLVNTAIGRWPYTATAHTGKPAGSIPSGGTKPPGAGNGNGSGNGGGSKYTVVSGDSLSLIAGKYWKDVLLWPILYDANKQVVGSDPNKIQIGQRLTVPSIAGLSSQQLSATRDRGRNWR